MTPEIHSVWKRIKGSFLNTLQPPRSVGSRGLRHRWRRTKELERVEFVFGQKVETGYRLRFRLYSVRLTFWVDLEGCLKLWQRVVMICVICSLNSRLPGLAKPVRFFIWIFVGFFIWIFSGVIWIIPGFLHIFSMKFKLESWIFQKSETPQVKMIFFSGGLLSGWAPSCQPWQYPVEWWNITRTTTIIGCAYWHCERHRLDKRLQEGRGSVDLQVWENWTGSFARRMAGNDPYDSGLN